MGGCQGKGILPAWEMGCPLIWHPCGVPGLWWIEGCLGGILTLSPNLAKVEEKSATFILWLPYSLSIKIWEPEYQKGRPIHMVSWDTHCSDHKFISGLIALVLLLYARGTEIFVKAGVAEHFMAVLTEACHIFEILLEQGTGISLFRSPSFLYFH